MGIVYLRPILPRQWPAQVMMGHRLNLGLTRVIVNTTLSCRTVLKHGVSYGATQVLL